MDMAEYQIIKYMHYYCKKMVYRYAGHNVTNIHMGNLSTVLPSFFGVKKSQMMAHTIFAQMFAALEVLKCQQYCAN